MVIVCMLQKYLQQVQIFVLQVNMFIMFRHETFQDNDRCSAEPTDKAQEPHSDFLFHLIKGPGEFTDKNFLKFSMTASQE